MSSLGHSQRSLFQDLPTQSQQEDEEDDEQDDDGNVDDDDGNDDDNDGVNFMIMHIGSRRGERIVITWNITKDV